ncbi:MAG: cell wall hydrolase [Oscillospiraceae bacterium]|nr:cell wall hydrolase [Oscillospiraceae bacterium]
MLKKYKTEIGFAEPFICLFFMLVTTVILYISVQLFELIIVIPVSLGVLSFHRTIILRLLNPINVFTYRIFGSFIVNWHKNTYNNSLRSINERICLQDCTSSTLEELRVVCRSHKKNFDYAIVKFGNHTNGHKPWRNLIAILALVCMIFCIIFYFLPMATALSHVFFTLHHEVREHLTQDTPQESTDDDIYYTPQTPTDNVTTDYHLYSSVTETRNTRILTEDEIRFLQFLIHWKAVGEDEKGQTLIVNVIFNRIDSPNYPDTVTCVIFEMGAFADTVRDDFNTVTPSDHTISAINRALDGIDYSLGATHFRSLRGITPYVWHEAAVREGRLTFLFDHGGHRFYREVHTP